MVLLFFLDTGSGPGGTAVVAVFLFLLYGHCTTSPSICSTGPPRAHYLVPHAPAVSSCAEHTLP